MAAPSRPSRDGAAMARLETAVRCHVTSILTRAGDGDGGRRQEARAETASAFFDALEAGVRLVEGLFDFVYIRVRCFAGRRCLPVAAASRCFAGREPLERSEGGGEALASEVKDVA